MARAFLEGILDAYVLHNADRHLSEYISPADKRVEKITGFTGSNAVVVVTAEERLLYTDSRYFIQAKAELRDGFRLMRMGVDTGLAQLLAERARHRKVVGIDKSLVSQREFASLSDRLSAEGISLMHVDAGEFFAEQLAAMPARQFNKILDLESIQLGPFLRAEGSPKSPDGRSWGNVTGSSRQDKIRDIAGDLKEGEALLVTELDTIAWIFNLRGTDIEYNPVFFSFAYITRETALLFVGAELEIEGVEVRRYGELEEFLGRVQDRILVSGMCSALLAEKARGPTFTDAVAERKSIKNETEAEGFRHAHLLDGLALTALFEWLQDEVPRGHVREADVSGKLVLLKQSAPGYRGESFEAICGSGPNSAIVHHSAGERLLGTDDIVLLDTGSQYLFGTTDVTRTLHLGRPTEEHRKVFTTVLRGSLRARGLVWAEGMQSTVVDALARMDLWREHRDFGHGTSHGVGHFLNVHESPPSFSGGYRLKAGQVMSIEPGFYTEDHFGVRIEDLVLVARAADGFCKFEQLTCVPLQLGLIDTEMLSADELREVNVYSAWVRKKLEPLLRGRPGHRWLLENTRELSRSS